VVQGSTGHFGNTPSGAAPKCTHMLIGKFGCGLRSFLVSGRMKLLFTMLCVKLPPF